MLATMAVDLVHIDRQDRPLTCRILNWCNAFKTVNSFFVVRVHGERKCLRYRVLKFDVCEMLMLALSLSDDGTNFRRSFFSSPVARSSSLCSDFSVTIFLPSFDVAKYIVFSIFKLNWKISAVCLFAFDVVFTPIFWWKAIVTRIAAISYS